MNRYILCVKHFLGLRFNFVTNRNTKLPPIPADNSINEIADEEVADGGQEGEDNEMEPLLGKQRKITTTVLWVNGTTIYMIGWTNYYRLQHVDICTGVYSHVQCNLLHFVSILLWPLYGPDFVSLFVTGYLRYNMSRDYKS